MRRSAKRVSTVVLAAAAGCCLVSAAASGAAGATGAAARSTASSAASGGHWTAAVPVPGLAALNVGGNASLLDLACVSGGNCAAGGSYMNDQGTQAWVANEVRGAWHRAEEVPGTARLNPTGNAEVDLVSCTGPGDCVAVGEAQDADHDQSPFVSTEADGGRWTTARSIAPEMDVQAISCPRAGDCVVGGDTAVNAPGGNADVSTEHGAAWGASKTLPGVTALGPDGSRVNTLTCTSPGNCVVGGTYSAPVSNPPGDVYQQVFVASETQGVWHRPIAVPGTARLNTGGDAQISALSCASAGDCSVGGSYLNRSGEYFIFVANEIRGTWGAARTIAGTPGTADAYDASTVSGLACTSAATCVAVGSVGADGFIAAEKDGTWARARLVPNLTRYGTSMQAVSCRSAGTCVATGSDGLGDSTDICSFGDESFAITEIKGTWSKLRTLTLPHGGETDGAALACGPDGDCSIGGVTQSRTNCQYAPATFGAYVAGYTPAGG